MKKFASLFLTVVMLAAMLSVFAVPASAEGDEPVEYDMSDHSINLNGGFYIISSGKHKISKIFISNSTLIIGKDATVSTGSRAIRIDSTSTVIIFGSLNFTGRSSITFEGKVYVESGGSITGDYNASNGVTYGHCYRDSVCLGCGYECPHQNGYADGKCKDCDYECPHINGFKNNDRKCSDCGIECSHKNGFEDRKCKDCGVDCPHQNGYADGKCKDCDYECPHTNGYADGKCTVCGIECLHTHIKTVCDNCGLDMPSTLTGSTLSEGSLTIICTVAAAVVFGLGGFFLGRKKKKPVLAGGTNHTDEE